MRVILCNKFVKNKNFPFMKKLAFFLFLGAILGACGGNSDSNTASTETTAATETKTTENGNPSYDPQRGEGKFKDVEVGAALDAPMAANGEKYTGLSAAVATNLPAKNWWARDGWCY